MDKVFAKPQKPDFGPIFDFWGVAVLLGLLFKFWDLPFFQHYDFVAKRKTPFLIFCIVNIRTGGQTGQTEANS